MALLCDFHHVNTYRQVPKQICKTFVNNRVACVLTPKNLSTRMSCLCVRISVSTFTCCDRTATHTLHAYGEQINNTFFCTIRQQQHSTIMISRALLRNGLVRQTIAAFSPALAAKRQTNLLNPSEFAGRSYSSLSSTASKARKPLSTQLLDPAAELDEFMSVFPDVMNSATSTVQRYELPATKQASTWLEQAMLYNVPRGKRNRGLLTVSTFKLLQARQQPPSDVASSKHRCTRNLSLSVHQLVSISVRDDLVRAQHLGWCVEMLQALFLVADDIMDHSETRRGRPCWYKVPAVGMTAINDTLMIENVIYTLLRQQFASTEYYTALLELFHEAMLVTCIGESLDLQSAEQPIETFSMQQYTAIVHNKTAFYSFYLPVASAMLMNGHRQQDAALFAHVRDILYEIGHFFQVQDDYLDCFGDPSVTGKHGTDIQDKKCSWLAVQCLERANGEQRALMERCYGRSDVEAVQQVKDLYRAMGLPQLYTAYEERSYEEIGERIRCLPDRMPRVIFEQIMEVIYRRKH